MKLKIIYPTKVTLDKYGLSKRDYKKLWDSIKGVCPICQVSPKAGRFRIDHEHAPRWKQMPPEKRKLFVRGLVCMFCNRYYLAKAINQEKAKNIVKYLNNYDNQKIRPI